MWCLAIRVVKEYGGHGIGRWFHEAPFVAHISPAALVGSGGGGVGVGVEGRRSGVPASEPAGTSSAVVLQGSAAAMLEEGMTFTIEPSERG